MATYEPLVWKDLSPEHPASAERFSHVDNGVKQAHDLIASLTSEVSKKANTPHTHTVAQISDASALGRTVLKGADAAAIRSAIGAGTGSSNLALGTTSTTALKGDYKPAWADITGKPTIPSATAVGTRAQLDAGTDTTSRSFTAKDLKEFVDARITELTQPEG